jgi:hypothetical protein
LLREPGAQRRNIRERAKGVANGKREEQTMVHELKSGKTVVERVAANALNRRALLMKSMAVAGVLGTGAGLDMAKEPANAAQSMEGTSLRNANVVLAHGAWADGSSWSKVIVGLNANGIKAWAALCLSRRSRTTSRRSTALWIASRVPSSLAGMPMRAP